VSEVEGVEQACEAARKLQTLWVFRHPGTVAVEGSQLSQLG
jgi:hypothetical protein